MIKISIQFLVESLFILFPSLIFVVILLQVITYETHVSQIELYFIFSVVALMNGLIYFYFISRKVNFIYRILLYLFSSIIIGMIPIPLLSKNYVVVGEFLRDYLGINIFYMDYSGWIIFNFIFLTGIFSSIILFFIEISKKID